MKTRKITLISVLLTISIIIQITENSLPLIPGIPGGKIGFTNIITILCIYLFDTKTSFIISVLRPVIACLIYGGLIQLLYGLSGSILSFAIMVLMMKGKNNFSYMGVSISGAVAHNFAQTTIAVILYSNIYIYTYLPPLLILSIISGYFTGFCSTIIIHKYKDRKKVNI